MHYLLLGPLAMVDDGPTDGETPRTRVVTVGGARQRALLAVLLAHRGRAVSEDVLVENLWPDGAPHSARHTLHTHVSRLRRLVGEDVRTVDGGYVLDAPTTSTDAGMFEDALARAARHEPPDAVVDLEHAVARWRGPAFGRAADLPAVRAEATRLDGLRLAALERLAEGLLALGRADDAIAAADAVTDADPYRERAWAVSVRARTAAGSPARALEHHRAAARALDEIGLLPGIELRAAQAEALAAGTAPSPADGLPVGRPARPPASGRRPPVPATSFVERPGEVEAVRALLGESRLVTLVGPGGVGKTRLALEVVRADEGRARFVELGAVTEADDVAAAVAAAAGLSAAAGPPAVALAGLGARDLVLVLDNCEHLADAAAEAVEQMLASAGPLRVLATSREALRVGAEHVHHVEPLDTGGPGSPAWRLFVERARAAGGLRPGGHAVAGAPEAVRAPDDVDPAVEHVLDMLDGLPLALEMAAARSSAVSFADLADELGSRLGDLAHPGRTPHAAHGSLAALVASSRDLLDPEGRRALDGWPVFAAAVTPGDAADVLQVSRATVEDLARRSLLRRDDAHGRTRLRMLHTVRAAIGVPADDDPLRARHAAVVESVVATAAGRLRGAGEAAARSRIGDLLAEARAAHAWARRSDTALAVRLTRALHDVALDGLLGDVLGWGAPLAARESENADPAVDASLAARLVLVGRHAEGTDRARRALESATLDHDRIRALEVLADAAMFDGRLAEAMDLGQRMGAIARATADRHYVAVAGSYAALLPAYTGDVARAREALARTHADLAEIGDVECPSTAGWLEFTAGEIAADDDPAAALAALRRARDLADEAGNRYLGGVARAAATSVARHGEVSQALAESADTLSWWLESGDRTHLVTTLRNLVVLLVRAGADVEAAELRGAVVAGAGLPAVYGTELERLDAAARTLGERLGDDELARRTAVGAARTPEQAAHVLLASRIVG